MRFLLSNMERPACSGAVVGKLLSVGSQKRFEDLGGKKSDLLPQRMSTVRMPVLRERMPGEEAMLGHSKTHQVGLSGGGSDTGQEGGMGAVRVGTWAGGQTCYAF